MNEFNPTFAAHVTSTAFNLTLSKSMIIRLVMVANSDIVSNLYRAAGINDNAVEAGQALKRRGLVWSPNAEFPGIYSLTEAGKLVFELLKIAGLVEPLETQLRKDIPQNA